MKLKNLKLLPFYLFFFCIQSVANEYPSIKFGGYGMLDYDRFAANFVEQSSTTNSQFDIRRLRFGFLANLNKDWTAKYYVDVANEVVDVKHANLKYSGWSLADIVIGKQKEGFGIDKLMSSKNLLLIERAVVSTVISPGISYGINLIGKQQGVNWQLGYFQQDTAKKGNAVTGRITWTPWREGSNLVHLGYGFSERSLHGETFQVNKKMEVSGADSIIEGFKITADTISHSGLEFVWQNNGVVNMAQWQHSSVKATNGDEFQYQGGYYQISYILSGKNRSYKKGILGGIEKGNDWEATMRFSQMLLLEENSRSKSLTIGLNYTLQNNLKFMLNLIRARYVSEGEKLKLGNAMSLRAQYHF